RRTGFFHQRLLQIRRSPLPDRLPIHSLESGRWTFPHSLPCNSPVPRRQRRSSSGFNMENKKRVLFLCTGNSARSQMAEGILRRLAGKDYDVASAGTHPKGVHPRTIEVMSEIGVDM